jgi:hypothetical protein
MKIIKINKSKGILNNMKGYLHTLLGVNVGLVNAALVNSKLYQMNQNADAGGIVFAGLVCTFLGEKFPDVDYILDTKFHLRKTIIGKFMFNDVSHRSIIHSILFYIPIYFMLFSLLSNNKDGTGIYLLNSFFIGIFLHLFQDCFTKAKTPFLFPVIKKNIGFGLVLSNSLMNIPITIAIFIGYLFMIYSFHEPISIFLSKPLL